MATKKSGRRGAGIIALIAVIAALAGPSAAAADPGMSLEPVYAGIPSESLDDGPGLLASWVEE